MKKEEKLIKLMNKKIDIALELAQTNHKMINANIKMHETTGNTLTNILKILSKLGALDGSDIREADSTVSE